MPTGGVTPAGGGGGTVTAVSSANTSIAVATPTTTPALTVATLDVLATNGPPAAAVALNAKKITGLAVASAATDAASLANTLDQFGAPAANVAFNAKKITGLANGSAATDAAAFGQIPAAGFLGYIVIQEQQAAGTAAGTFTSGAWRTRVLNTTVSDTHSDVVSLASNQITLVAGVYRAEISAPAFGVNQNQTRLFNVTDSALLLPGTSEFALIGSDVGGSRSFIVGTFTIAASKALEVQHQCNTTRATNGLGAASNFAQTEVYTVVQLYRVS